MHASQTPDTESMNIQTESDITPEVALTLRKLSGLTQTEFWEGVGSNQGSGHLFEGGKRKGIPKPIRRLIFLKHVAGMPVDVSTPQAASLVVKHGKEVAAKIEMERATEAAQEAARAAKEAQQKVKRLSA